VYELHTDEHMNIKAFIQSTFTDEFIDHVFALIAEFKEVSDMFTFLSNIFIYCCATKELISLEYNDKIFELIIRMIKTMILESVDDYL